MTSFDTLGLAPQTLKTLSSLGFKTPTPIQAEAIPLVLAGHDLIGLAQTGTGKTAAFGLPLIEHLREDGGRPRPRNTRALILAPTRELANQIAAHLKDFVRNTPMRVGIVVGGASINRQADMLKRGLDVLVATPGRLLDLVDRNALSLGDVERLVLDEADQMLDLGFIHDLRKIVKLVPAKRQTLLFSATMPRQIAELAATFLTDPKRVEVSPPGKAADKVTQSVHFVADKNEKTTLLSRSLSDNPNGLALVFSRTKHGAEKLMKQLKNSGFEAASIHGNKSQGQRERALKAFRDGQTRVLVATDVAARGIDVPAVTHVYNYDLPEVPDAYVHRIGRTARAGRDGEAIAFCTPDEIRLLRDIERLTGVDVSVASGDVPADQGRPRSKGRNGNAGRGPKRAQSGRPAHAGARNGGGKPGSGKPRRNTANATPGRSGGQFTALVGEISNGGADNAGQTAPKRKPHRKGQGNGAPTGPNPDNRNRNGKRQEGRNRSAGQRSYA